MNELIKINSKNKVDGRSLHEFLQIETPFKKWIDRMLEYGFVEGVDFWTEDKNVRRADGAIMPQKLTEYELTIDMAKEISMIQRNERGKQARLYFIECEKRLRALNAPSYQIADPIERAKAWIKEQEKVKALVATNKQQEQIIGELKPKADYTDRILQNKGLVTITQIAKAYGMSGTPMNELLHSLKVIYKLGKQWLLYSKYQAKGYTHSETVDITHKDGTPDVVMNTKWTQKGRLFLYELLKKNDVDEQGSWERKQ